MTIAKTGDLVAQRAAVFEDGYLVINGIYTHAEVENLISAINSLDSSGPLCRKTGDLFAIRQFIKQFPAIKRLVFNAKLQSAIAGLFGGVYFVVKSIYFDKPEKSNWFVAWHQDLTISVGKKKKFWGSAPGQLSKTSLPYNRRLIFWKETLPFAYTWTIPAGITAP